MPATRHQRGFTLLELVVSVSLTALVLMLLLTGLRVTEGAWRRGMRRLTATSQMLAADEAMHAQMSSAVARRITTQHEQRQWQLISFRGDGREVRFLSNFSWLSGRSYGLWLVDYRVVHESDGKEQLVVSERGLSDEQELTAFLLSDQQPTRPGFILIEHADHIELSYFRASSPGTPAAWVSEWKCADQKQLPRGIHIRWQYGAERRDLTLVIPVGEEMS